MGALYLASKLQECPVRMRDLINVYDILIQRTAHKRKALASRDPHPPELKYVPMSYFGNTFYDLKDALVVSEMQILKRLGFNVNVVLPYGTLVNYLRLLGLTGRDDVCQRAWGYLNDAYVFAFSPWPLWIERSLDYRHPCMHCTPYRQLSARQYCSQHAIVILRCPPNLRIIGGRSLTRSGKTFGVCLGTSCGCIVLGHWRNSCDRWG